MTKATWGSHVLRDTKKQPLAGATSFEAKRPGQMTMTHAQKKTCPQQIKGLIMFHTKWVPYSVKSSQTFDPRNKDNDQTSMDPKCQPKLISRAWHDNRCLDMEKPKSEGRLASHPSSHRCNGSQFPVPAEVCAAYFRPRGPAHSALALCLASLGFNKGKKHGPSNTSTNLKHPSWDFLQCSTNPPHGCNGIGH